MLRRAFLTTVAAMIGLGSLATMARADGPDLGWDRKTATFRLLVLIKTATHVPPTPLPPTPASKSPDPLEKSDVELTQGQIDQIKRSFRLAQLAVADWSRDRIHWELTYKLLPANLPLTSVTPFHPVAFGSTQPDPNRWDFYPTSKDVLADLKEQAPPGEYDGVFLVYAWLKGPLGPFPAADGITTDTTSRGGFSAIPYKLNTPTSTPWEKDTTPIGQIVHEWLHQVTMFYTSKELFGEQRLTVLPPHDVHGYQFAAETGYGEARATQYYKDYLNSEVTWGGSDTNNPKKLPGGLAGHIPSYPTIREWYRASQALVPTAVNRLRNGTLTEEQDAAGNPVASWDFEVADENDDHINVDTAPEEDTCGQCITLDFKTDNTFAVSQKVFLLGGQSCTLSARVKVENLGGTGKADGLALLAFGPDGKPVDGSEGAMLANQEPCPFLDKTSDWVQVRLVFKTSAAGNYKVGLRAGKDGSPIKGKISFRDFCLVQPPLEAK